MGHLGHISHTWQLIHQAGHTAHIFHLLQLVAQILKVKALALGYFFGNLLGFLFIYLALNILDKRHNIAHTQDSRGDTLGMERLQGIGFFTHTEEFDRLAGDMPYRECCTTAGITVHLGEDNTGQRQGLIKGPGSIDRILADHGVDNKQCLHRISGFMNLFDLRHHLAVYVEATGGIHNQHIDKLLLGAGNSSVNYIDRLLAGFTGEKLCINLTREGLQLLYGRRTIDIGRDNHNLLLFPLIQVAGQLCHRGGFTSTLQASHQNNCRRLG